MFESYIEKREYDLKYAVLTAEQKALDAEQKALDARKEVLDAREEELDAREQLLSILFIIFENRDCEGNIELNKSYRQKLLEIKNNLTV